MGLFTQDKVDYNIPVEQRMLDRAAKSQRQFTDTYLDPAIKENIGYESPRMKMKALTKGVDLTDGKKVQETFLALQAIDPQEALGWLESIKPVIAQQLTSLKIKEADLKFTQAKNKPLVKQRWSLQGRPNFITSYAETALAGLEGQEDLVAALKTAPPEQKEFLINAFLNKIPKENDGAAYKTDYKNKLKAASTAYLDLWGSRKDLDGDLEFNGTQRNTGGLKSTADKNTPDPTSKEPLYKQAPQQSQLRQAAGAISTDFNLWKELQSVEGSLTGFMPEFLMTDKELELENRRDSVGDWISDGKAHDYFLKAGAKELAKFKANPVEYYERVTKKAK